MKNGGFPVSDRAISKAVTKTMIWSSLDVVVSSMMLLHTSSLRETLDCSYVHGTKSENFFFDKVSNIPFPMFMKRTIPFSPQALKRVSLHTNQN